MNFLNLIRYKNLILLAFMQLIFRFGFLKLQKIDLALADWQYLLLVLSTVLIAAGGYVINNIFDQDTDAENTPNKVIVGKSISETKAYYIYVILTLSGVFIGYYLSNVIQRPMFLVLFILVASLLYFYATTLKQIAIVGNICVAFSLAFSVLIIGFFDIFPATAFDNQKIMSEIFAILLNYATFAFIINFLREIVKDLEDIKGDDLQGMRTLPIIIGEKLSAKILAILCAIPMLLSLFYINNHLMSNKLYFATIYGLITVVAPISYCGISLWNSKNKADYHHISSVFKWIIFFGILSIIVINQNIVHNV